MKSDLCLCPICCFEYNDSKQLPKIFPCGHTICSHCIDNISNAQNGLKCPVCCKAIPLNMAISTNYVLLSLIEEIKSNRRLMCRYHTEHKADHVCLQDKCRVCLYCKVYGEHKDHTCVTMKDFQDGIEMKKKDVENVLEGLKKSSFGVLEFYNQEKNKLIKNIEVNFNKMIHLINQIKIETIGKVQKNFDKAVKNTDHYKAYEEVWRKIILLEHKSSIKLDESSDESILTAFSFLNENLESFFQANGICIENNKSVSTKFFNQTSSILEELQKDILKRLYISSGELESAILLPDLSLSSEMKNLIENLGEQNSSDIQNKKDQLKKETVIISTSKGPLKLNVKYSDTIQSIQKKLIEMGECELKDCLSYQNHLLHNHLTVFDYNLQINYSIKIRKMGSPNTN